MDLVEVPGTAFRRHPWEVARARFFRRLLRDAGLLQAPLSVLDVGAGDGYLARSLMKGLPPGSAITCFDANYSDDDLSRFAAPARPGLSFVRTPPPGRFDLILLLDVMEHVEDDTALLQRLVAESLAPGGAVLVSVPAWQSLFSRHDEAMLHHRRYSPAECRALLEREGLTLRKRGGLFHTLLAPRALAVAGERLMRGLGRERVAAPPNLGVWTGGPRLTGVLERALAADNALSHLLARLGVALPGLSLWALCDGPARASRGAHHT
jgi:SAM-dependent methyltransferase